MKVKNLIHSLTASVMAICNAQAEEQSFDFEKALKKHENSTFGDFIARTPQQNYLKAIAFDPTKSKFYDLVSQKLMLNPAEKKIFKQKGFVSVDHDQRYSFGSAYFGIYTRDLPVLVTTDSILHALHKSFDRTLMSVEQHYFMPQLKLVLEKLSKELATAASLAEHSESRQTFEDLDLYLTVARNLLEGARSLKIKTELDQDGQVLEILRLVSAAKINSPVEIYGEKREIDFSQFLPRGHYNKSPDLKRYFRAMMWMGRSDCGFNVLPPKTPTLINVDPERGRRASLLLAHLLKASDTAATVAKMKQSISLLIGEEDGLTVHQLFVAMDQIGIDGIASIRDPQKLAKYKDWLETSGNGNQSIRSQLVYKETSAKTSVPGVCNLFGQRFIVDSFILSKLVYDSIEFKNRPVKRMLPKGLDVMASLGSPLASKMLNQEMVRYPYAANMMACQDYISTYDQKKWNATVYKRWINLLRGLDRIPKDKTFFPQIMQTEAWGLKQLQTQLASWSQLRHDTVLYAKQSYSGGVFCDYPVGYVEPYPEVYAQLGDLASALSDCISESEMKPRLKESLVRFWQTFSQTQSKLETLSRKQLSGTPFTGEEEMFLKKTIDQRGGGSGPPRYDGWYADLFLVREDSFEWNPEIIDVHTSPDNNGISECLEVGTGDVNYLVAAIDNGKDVTCYVGPAFSYYEFVQSLNGTSKRLTDESWAKILYANPQNRAARPDWIKAFQGPSQKRELK